tara:strand:+ start:13061 stop:13906 length:846 start_codon:yes stop_codon:yes gene_type:complete
MGKKILLPTDFSKYSWNAIQYAMKLFESEACDFYIMNTYTKYSYGLENLNRLDPDEAFNKLSENRSKKELGKIMICLMFENANPLHKFHVLSRSEQFLDAVKNAVEELKIDTIVMGAKGMTNEREGQYGKNTLEVIEVVRKCPVLVIPKNISFERPQEIVLATNFKTDFQASEVNHLVEIAKLSKASIQILSLAENGDLSPKQKENKMRLRNHLKGVEHSFNILHNVKMATALSCFVEIRQSNMISYIDRKPSFWERLGFGKPTLGKLGYFKDVPVLALHG